MLCTHCRRRDAVDGTGLCPECAHAATPAAAPGPPAPAFPDAYLTRPVSVDGLTSAVVVLLAACIAADLFSLVAGGLMYAAADAEAARRGTNLSATAAGLQALGLILCGILFIIWMRRVRFNAEIYSPDGQRLSGGWVFWGWVVPVVNFWYPRRIIADIWRSSVPWTTGEGVPRLAAGPVNLWWACWLTGTVAQFAVTEPDPDGSVEAIRDAAVGWALLDVLNIATAALAIVVVLTIARMQRAKNALGAPYLLV
ncbi:DUF4328 domain-containing protein [Streptomyces sp. NPDC058001]|uniref:DUF4328 domain-containing protein n=1 Tax=Streptomyces sp. NPDC058001 TaxID=3346300 RepID=UPI0036E138C6